MFVLILVGISGCSNSNNTNTSNSNSGQQKVIYEGDLGGKNSNWTYIPVDAKNVTVEISKVQTLDPVNQLILNSLTIVPENGTNVNKYLSNNIEATSWTNVNDTLNTSYKFTGGFKSIAITTNNLMFHIKILA